MTRNQWIVIIVAEALGLCCCAGLIGLFLIGSFSGTTVAPTVLAQATAPSPGTSTPTLAPSATETAAPTYTLVIPRGSTPAFLNRASASPTAARPYITPPSNLYNVIIPTPTAPPNLTYPIGYQTTFAVVTYPVTGTTASAVSKSLDANAMSDPHEPSNRFYARTDWYLGTHWLWKETPRGCEVDQADVTIALTMTLPALAAPNVPSDLQNRWSTFIKNTVTHESGHVKLAEQGARDYQRGLGTFPPAPSCDVIKTRLQDLFDKSFAVIDQANVQYDADTRHGVTQGAVFP